MKLAAAALGLVLAGPISAQLPPIYGCWISKIEFADGTATVHFGKGASGFGMLTPATEPEKALARFRIGSADQSIAVRPGDRGSFSGSHAGCTFMWSTRGERAGLKVTAWSGESPGPPRVFVTFAPQPQ